MNLYVNGACLRAVFGLTLYNLSVTFLEPWFVCAWILLQVVFHLVDGKQCYAHAPRVSAVASIILALALLYYFPTTVLMVCRLRCSLSPYSTFGAYMLRFSVDPGNLGPAAVTMLKLGHYRRAKLTASTLCTTSLTRLQPLLLGRQDRLLASIVSGVR